MDDDPCEVNTSITDIAIITMTDGSKTTVDLSCTASSRVGQVFPLQEDKNTTLLAAFRGGISMTSTEEVAEFCYAMVRERDHGHKGKSKKGKGKGKHKAPIAVHVDVIAEILDDITYPNENSTCSTPEGLNLQVRVYFSREATCERRKEENRLASLRSHLSSSNSDTISNAIDNDSNDTNNM